MRNEGKIDVMPQMQQAPGPESPESKGLQRRKRLLLHSCCGPCSTACVERLEEEYDVTLYFYNPNITDEEEYRKRLETQLQFGRAYNEAGGRLAGIIEGPYDPEEFYRCAAGLEDEPEGGKRCTECFRLRLEKTGEAAAEGRFDAFCTTLTVSPHKDAKRINELGNQIADSLAQTTGNAGQAAFIYSDFKKKDGYRRSVELSREYGLYRQNYCGCEFSKWWKNTKGEDEVR